MRMAARGAGGITGRWLSLERLIWIYALSNQPAPDPAPGDRGAGRQGERREPRALQWTWSGREGKIAPA